MCSKSWNCIVSFNQSKGYHLSIDISEYCHFVAYNYKFLDHVNGSKLGSKCLLFWVSYLETRGEKVSLPRVDRGEKRGKIVSSQDKPRQTWATVKMLSPMFYIIHLIYKLSRNCYSSSGWARETANIVKFLIGAITR